MWGVLTPYMERKPLYELQNKTVAIDLSCWVVEAKTITDYEIQPRMYLRNLYFRTCFLLLLNVKVVFVLEGKAPELKYQTIADRNKLQFKGCKPKTSTTKTTKGRTRFNHTLKQCEELLKLMGLACVQGEGEAEATCAYLNYEGLIDGCISQDSDCFAYGAKIVYRNFSISQQGPFASSGGAVDVYNIQKSMDAVDFGRNKIVSMALLCGSDYTEGVHGVGKDSALKMFERFSDDDILKRISSWKTDAHLFEELERGLNDKNKCTSCGHAGKIQGHTRNGCIKCATAKGCLETYKEEYKAVKNELSMRSKALADPDFPNQELIKEFMDKKDSIRKVDLVWKQPDILKFIIFTVKYLEWEELYAFEKIFPILTRWQLLNFEKVQKGVVKNIFSPDYIKKIRNPKGVPSYEIIWTDPHNYFTNIIPEEQLENVDKVKLYSTVEPQELVREAYKEIVQAWELSKVKVKKPSKRKIKDKKDVDEITNMLLNTSITAEPKAKTKRTCKKKGQAKINTYFKAAVEIGKKETELDVSNFGDEDDFSNLSGIIDNITKSKPSYLDNIDFMDTNFFGDSLCDNDLFEKSMRRFDENTSEDEEIGKTSQNSDEKDENESDNDSFIEIYKPLAERMAFKITK